MKQFVLLVALLACVCAACAQTITQAEWFVGTDPGQGLANPITVSTPDDSVNLSFTVPTGSLSPGLYRVFVRCRSNGGVWGAPSPRLLTIVPGSGVARLVTAVEYWFDSGAPTFLDVTDDDSVTFNQILSTASLNPGLHRFYLRCRDDLGRWGAAHVALLVVFGTTPPVARLVTAVEYWFDSNAPTLLDVTDDDSVSFDQMLSTASLSPGLHKFFLRCRDDLGRWGSPHIALLVVSDSISAVTRLITAIEYWVDSNAPTFVDVADSAQVNISELVGTSSLDVGLHYVHMRCRDDLGRWGAAERRPLIVTSPFVTSEPRELTAAEFFVNVDPGPGNGVSIPLPQDSLWDEGEETAETVITGIPIGLHRVGIRFRDDLGRWSQPVLDSLIVGPVVTVRPSGNDLILDWLSGSGVDEFYIYRAAIPTGPFAVIDSTAAQTYTDVGITATQAKMFYRVTFSAGALSSFRLPEATPARE
ncbi:MAG: hypothetical protein V1784_05090 [bacterium]